MRIAFVFIILFASFAVGAAAARRPCEAALTCPDGYTSIFLAPTDVFDPKIKSLANSPLH
jgi:hypothetical protein